MVTCKNKLFNKFLLISFVFFVLSTVINITIVFSAVSLPSKTAKAKQTTEKIYTQQEIILEKLDRVEKKMKKKRRGRLRRVE